MQKIAIIIPCYNEEKRLQKSSVLDLLERTTADVIFANDGSTDNTFGVITSFCAHHPERCSVLNYEKNSGKANTIYKAVNDLLAVGKYDYIGYFDADFSTPPSEIARILKCTQEKSHRFFLGSRILLLNSGIKRKFHRHVIGRVIITMINLKFKLSIYDTQCGAKLFGTEILEAAFTKPFHTSWLFDVEIFIRLKQLNLLQKGKEIPIYDWKDVDGSKLGLKTGFKIIKELYLLVKNY